jgi:hypothetical protein
MVIINFIRDQEVGMFARAKRVGKGAKKDEINVRKMGEKIR